MDNSSYTTLDLTLISAQDLHNVNLLSRLEVYAAASLSSDPSIKQRTVTDRTELQNPKWNSTLHFSIPYAAAVQGVNLVITLHAERALGDRLVGEVCIPIKDLQADSVSTSTVRRVSYQVRRPCGSHKGILNISYKFSDAATYLSSPPLYPSAAATTYAPLMKMDAPFYPSTGAGYSPPGYMTSCSACACQAPTPPVGYTVYIQQQSNPQVYGGYGHGAAPVPAAYWSSPAAHGCWCTGQPAYWGSGFGHRFDFGFQ